VRAGTHLDAQAGIWQAMAPPHKAPLPYDVQDIPQLDLPCCWSSDHHLHIMRAADAIAAAAGGAVAQV
jgi:hypothetical protein